MMYGQGIFSYQEQPYIHIKGMSSNGKYVVGQIGPRMGVPFRYSVDEGVKTTEGVVAVGVANDGTVVGRFRDADAEELEWAGLYVGEWGLGNWLDLNATGNMMGGGANVISNDKTIIGGENSPIPGGFQPAIWRISGDQITMEEFPVEVPPNTLVIGQVTKMSGDGRIMGGEVQNGRFMKIVHLWIDGVVKTFKLPDGSFLTGSIAISNNGQYVVVNGGGGAAFYDFETGELKNRYAGIEVVGVSDNGLCIGWYSEGACFFSEKMGVMGFWDYLQRAGVERPDLGVEYRIVSLGDISADGLSVCGTLQYEPYADAGTSDGIFHVKLDHLLDINVEFVHELRWLETSPGNIVLSWDAVAPSESGDVLQGYNIYRNKVKVNTDPITATSYSDSNLPNGSYTYTVKAVWRNFGEATASNPQTIVSAIVDLPVFEDFLEGYVFTRYTPEEGFVDIMLGLDSHYWTSNEWIVNFNGGIPVPALSLTLLSLKDHYRFDFTSPWIRTNNASSLTLSYNLYISELRNAAATNNGRLYVEMYDGTEWIILYTHTPTASGTNGFIWNSVEFPADKIAGRDLVRFRFRAEGDPTEIPFLYLLDNVAFSQEKFAIIKPADVSVNYDKNDNRVYLNWSDPSGYVKLSYMEDESNYLKNVIGNNGKPFIAAIKYTADDLKNFNDYTLTTMSFFPPYLQSVTPTFQLVVYKGKQLVHSQNIPLVMLQSWNQIALDKPVKIESGYDYYFGIKVLTHGNNDLPLGLQKGRYALDGSTPLELYDGRSNLTSEDDGQTWQTLLNEDLEGVHMIKAELNKNPAGSKNRYNLGYYVLRDGRSIFNNGEITIAHNVVDMTPNLSNGHPESCYKVVAYYINHETAEGDAQCVSVTAIPDVANGAAFSVYPNPVSDMLYIEGEYISARLLTLSGQTVKTINGNSVSVKEIPAGVYILEATTNSGVMKEKIIVK